MSSGQNPKIDTTGEPRSRKARDPPTSSGQALGQPPVFPLSTLKTSRVIARPRCRPPAGWTRGNHLAGMSRQATRANYRLDSQKGQADDVHKMSTRTHQKMWVFGAKQDSALSLSAVPWCRRCGPLTVLYFGLRLGELPFVARRNSFPLSRLFYAHSIRRRIWRRWNSGG